MFRWFKLWRASKARPFQPAFVEREGGLSAETQGKLIALAIRRATYGR